MCINATVIVSRCAPTSARALASIQTHLQFALMDSFSVDVLPAPVPDHDTLLEYSSRLKTLRLRSLKEEVNSFVSRYESEVQEPEEFWVNRLKDDRAIHLLLVREDPPGGNTPLLQKQWVGFVVVLAPDNREKSEGRSTVQEWHMAALYIEPEVRGLGLGKRLVQATFDYIKKNSTREEGDSVSYKTTVVHGNDKALKLYQNLGFRIVDSNEPLEKEGRKYLSTRLGMDL